MAVRKIPEICSQKPPINSSDVEKVHAREMRKMMQFLNEVFPTDLVIIRSIQSYFYSLKNLHAMYTINEEQFFAIQKNLSNFFYELVGSILHLEYQCLEDIHEVINQVYYAFQQYSCLIQPTELDIPVLLSQLSARFFETESLILLYHSRNRYPL